MGIVVIGGHSRNIGKTSVVCALIASMPERHWTAIKITQCKHGAVNAESCDCELGGEATAVSEESDPSSGTDSSRYLAAGAVRSLWVRTRPGHLSQAMPRIRDEIAGAENIILESNSVLGLVQPDVYACVIDPRVTDFKASAIEFFGRAEAILIPEGMEGRANWPKSLESIEGVPTFRMASPTYNSPEFASFVAQKLDRAKR
jgi:hypothetical protein